MVTSSDCVTSVCASVSFDSGCISCIGGGNSTAASSSPPSSGGGAMAAADAGLKLELIGDDVVGTAGFRLGVKQA